MRENGPRRVIPAEFRQEAVALMERGGMSYRELSKRLGVGETTLYKWYKAEMARKKARRPKTASPEAQAAQAEESLKQRVARLEKENARLQRDNARLEEDRAILKKAAVWFAKEHE
jgi:transposase